MNELGRIPAAGVEAFHRAQPTASNAYTGERLSLGHSLQTELEHYHRYYLARDPARGRDVLDIACGEGSGPLAR